MRKLWYVHKYEVSQQYGGPEEGGWWFEVGVPVEDFNRPCFDDEEEAYKFSRKCNELEHERREKEEDYDYSSVLAYKSRHYAFSVEDFDTPQPYPQNRPHYE